MTITVAVALFVGLGATACGAAVVWWRFAPRFDERADGDGRTGDFSRWGIAAGFAAIGLGAFALAVESFLTVRRLSALASGSAEADPGGAVATVVSAVPWGLVGALSLLAGLGTVLVAMLAMIAGRRSRAVGERD